MLKISIQRLRNLTTSKLHTRLDDLHEDFERILGKPISSQSYEYARQAILLWLHENLKDPRFWDETYDPTHIGEVKLIEPTETERVFMLSIMKTSAGLSF
jgi:hypothetical protein